MIRPRRERLPLRHFELHDDGVMPPAFAGLVSRPPSCIENTFLRYKSVVGGRLRARHPRAQATEALLDCNMLNRMLELGRPASAAIRAESLG